MDMDKISLTTKIVQFGDRREFHANGIASRSMGCNTTHRIFYFYSFAENYTQDVINMMTKRASLNKKFKYTDTQEIYHLPTVVTASAVLVVHK